MKNTNKKIIYSILFIAFVAKIVSLNMDKINDLYLYVRYEVSTKDYHKLLTYQQFLDNKQNIQGIYFGSFQCPHCVKNIKSINSITDNNKEIYYFMVDFDDPGNQENLEKFKKRFKFKTIPHIVLLRDEGEKQYTSKDIAKHIK